MNIIKIKIAVSSGNAELIEEAFNDIYDEYNKLIFFIISKYIKKNDVIEDIKNDTFLSFFNNISNIDLNKNIKYYLTVTAKNKALDYLKKKDNNIELNDELVNSVEDNKPKYSYDDLVEEMKKSLSDEEIEIIIAHTVFNEKFKDLAVRLNKKQNSIISTYHRAITKFRKSQGK